MSELHLVSGRIPVLVLGTLSLFPLLPEVAFAQARDAENIEQITLVSELSHLGNAARSNKAAASARGLSVEDQRLRVGADIVFARNLGRHSLNLNGSIGYDFYRRNERLNRERIGLGAEAGIFAGPCHVTLGADVDRRQSDLDTIALINAPGLDSVRNAQTSQAYRVEARCGYVYGLRPMVGYEHSRGDNSNSIREISDYRSDRIYAGVDYAHPVVGDLSLSLSRDDLTYPKRKGTPLAAQSGYRVEDLRLKASREIGAFLTAEAEIGYNRLRPDNGATPTFKGVMWKLGGKATIGARLQVEASTERTLRPSLGAEALFSKDRRFALRGTYAINPRMSFVADFVRADRKYGGAQSNFGPLLTNDRLDRASAALNYRPNDRLALAAEIGHEKRRANGIIYDYAGTFVGLRSRLTL